MKNLLTLLTSALIYFNASSTILRVNNNYGIVTNYSTFTTVQQAHDAANIGDTIHLESSVTPYGSLNATKQLVWIGPGYFIGPGGNNNVGLQHHTNEATLGLQCSPGSGGSVFIGINLVGNSNTYSSIDVIIATSNITIKRCKTTNLKFYSFGPNNSSNFTITESFIAGSLQNVSGAAGTGNYYISNNYIQNGVQLPSNFFGVIIINNFIQETSSITVGSFTNNIINNYTGNNTLCSDPGNVRNNLFMFQTNSNYVGSNGNIYVSASPGLMNNVLTAPFSNTYDSWMTLKPGSPAIGAGFGGVDIGPFGGASPYKLSGIPPIPSVYYFNVNIAPGTNLLPCLISTRSNN